MKSVSAKATFTERAEKLFSTPDNARAVLVKVLEARNASDGKFLVNGHTVRTSRPNRLKK